MATLPDIQALQEGLIEIFAIFHNDRPRPKDGLQWGSIRDEWDMRGFRGPDFERLVKHMISEGTLSEVNGFYALTDKAVQDGLITLQTLEEVERAILDYFNSSNARAGDTFMPHAIQMALFEDGFTAVQYAEGCESLLKKGFLIAYMDQLRLTELGFNAM